MTPRPPFTGAMGRAARRSACGIRPLPVEGASREHFTETSGSASNLHSRLNEGGEV